MNVLNFELINNNTCTEKYISIHFPEFREYLLNNYPDDLKWNERLYWYYHNIDKYPTCPICGKRLKILSFGRGYPKYCSIKCSNSSPEKLQQTRTTNFKKYGGPAPYCSSDVKKKGESKCIDKYGVKNAMQNKEISSKSKQSNVEKYGGCGNASNIIKEKYKKTCLDKFGEDNPMKSDIVKQTYQINSYKKYGVKHPSQLTNVKNKIKKSRQIYEINSLDYLIDYTNEGDWICKCPHLNCDKCQEKSYTISPLLFECRCRNNTELCTKLLPIGTDTTKGTTIELFIRDILNKYNVPYEINVKDLIKPKEIDIYIPDKKIGIECNGVYMHSHKFKNKSYHIEKTNLCTSKNINLLHIWEDWIKIKPNIVESIILNKLGLIDNTIYARKCIVKTIDSKTCNDFLNEHHIQGVSNASIHLGLYYNDDIVSVMTFSKPRVNMGAKNHKQQWELVRFCSKTYTRVIGGASKLFKYFIKQYDPESIVSFSMNDISNGDLYKQLGFINDGSNNSYWYIEPKTLKRYHRTSFTKQAIVKKGWRDKVDPSWTEKQVMDEQEYFCIYDSGQTKWVWNKNNL